ncbi:MAG: WGR domain-containing protein [Kofleriaceae bacterium]
MKRFEFSEGSANKFWEAETKGKELRIRFGKIGSGGQLKLKVLASPAAAEAEMAKAIAEKTKKGYAAIGGKAEPKAAPVSGIKPAHLKVTQISTSKVHRIALFDDEVGHVALGTGGNCFASSDGKKFQRRPSSPGASYGLGLTNFNLTGQLVEPLATSKLLPQLAELDLSMGTLGDEHVTKLFAMQAAFAHLTKLDVNDNYLTNEGKSLLEQAKLAVHFGEQRDDEGDPSDRYASAYE